MVEVVDVVELISTVDVEVDVVLPVVVVVLVLVVEVDCPQGGHSAHWGTKSQTLYQSQPGACAAVEQILQIKP